MPGCYYADGFAGETSSESSSIWRAHFAPDEPGAWAWKCSFRRGQNIAMFDGDDFSERTHFDGNTGTFEIKPPISWGTTSEPRDDWEYMGERCLRFAGTGQAFLKGPRGQSGKPPRLC